MLLAFLNLGASEILLILLIILVLFGADKAPQLARTLGKARSELDRARGQLTEALRTDADKELDAQLAFERERERKIAEAAAQADPEEAALLRAADELGLQTQGLSKEEIKTAIRAKLGGADRVA